MDSSFEKRLRAVPWHELKTASRHAGHIPDAVMDLISPDPDTRRKAYWRIDNVVVLQGTLFEAAFPIAPFLAELAVDQTIAGRDLVYKALFEIVNGYPHHENADVEVSGQTVPMRQAIHDKLRPYRSVFKRDLQDRDEDIRRDAHDILECLDEGENCGD